MRKGDTLSRNFLTPRSKPSPVKRSEEEIMRDVRGQAAVAPRQTPAWWENKAHGPSGPPPQANKNRAVFAFEPGGPLRIELTWDDRLDDTRVFVDGELVHSFVGHHQLKQGAKISLRDGTILDVQWRGLGGFDLRRNGAPLPGSGSDRTAALPAAARTMFWVGGLGFAFDVEHILRASSHDVLWWYGAVGAFLDGVLLLLAVLTRRGARWALGVGAAWTLFAAFVTWSFDGSWIQITWRGLIFFLLFQRFVATRATASRR
jgi:hypothetical protein